MEVIPVPHSMYNIYNMDCFGWLLVSSDISRDCFSTVNTNCNLSITVQHNTMACIIIHNNILQTLVLLCITVQHNTVLILYIQCTLRIHNNSSTQYCINIHMYTVYFAYT